MDPFFLLEAQHEMVRTLLDILGERSKFGSARKAIVVQRAADVIRANSRVEVEILSKALLKVSEPNIAYVPHSGCIERHLLVAGVLVPNLLAATCGSMLFYGRLLVLRECTEALFGQEEREIFPGLGALFTTEELAAFSSLIDCFSPSRFTHWK